MLYKLMVLYMLNKVDFPLTNSQISEFILDKGYTNYFTLQQMFGTVTGNPVDNHIRRHMLNTADEDIRVFFQC